MTKLNIVDLEMKNHTLKFCVSTIKALLLELNLGILKTAYVQEQMEMNRKRILKLHKEIYYYKQSKSTGRWYSYLPKEGVKPPKGKKIEYATEEKLENKILDHYLETEKLEIAASTIPTFKEMYFRWRKIHDMRLADSSIARYDCDYNRFFQYSDFEEMKITEITENTIEEFILGKVKGKLCREACKDLVMYIKKTIRHAKRERVIVEDVAEFLGLRDFISFCTDFERPIEKIQYSDMDVKDMLEFLHLEYERNPNYLPLYAIELAIYTGMRVGELCGLKWEDIIEDSFLIRRSIKYKPRKKEYYIGDVKNKRPRVFPVDESIKKLLERIKKVYEENGTLCEWVFAKDGSYINTRIISSCNKNKWKKLGRKPKNGINGYRHRLSSNLRTKGVSDIIVASMLGHSIETNNRHYTRSTASIEEMVAIIRAENEHFVLQNSVGNF